MNKIGPPKKPTKGVKGVSTDPSAPYPNHLPTPLVYIMFTIVSNKVY